MKLLCFQVLGLLFQVAANAYNCLQGDYMDKLPANMSYSSSKLMQCPSEPALLWNLFTCRCYQPPVCAAVTAEPFFLKQMTLHHCLAGFIGQEA